jgi:3-phosphoshikimate 1-carboxyvinyltransferase
LDKISIERAAMLKGKVSPPPDKSLSHRAVILSSLAKGKGVVRNFLRAKDTESTMNAFRALGIEIREDGNNLTIFGKGLYGLAEPDDVIDCGNSGTTIRLLSGILSANPFFSVLTGDSSLRSRPMARIIKPLSLMGAHITAREDNTHAPLAIKGGMLRPVQYPMPMASAQVKSSIILAGLYIDGKTEVIEPAKSRDHTERMLPAFGADVTSDGLTVTVRGGAELHPLEITVPGDFSSAAFFIVGAAITPGSEVVLRSVGINPTRTGLLDVLKIMGADIEITDMHTVSGEPVADICCRGKGRLKAVSVSEEIIPALIDEFPVLCVAASLADGVTTIRGAAELRVKESDRIRAMASELGKMGVSVEEHDDGISITGTDALHGTEVEGHGDHRIAMAMAVAGLAAEGVTTISGVSAVDISFPDFFPILRKLCP